ncbi:MAG: hypothetical protein ACPMAQ_01420 [Phycisphaerae bacterium]
MLRRGACVCGGQSRARIAATPVSQLDPFLPDRWKAAHLPDG